MSHGGAVGRTEDGERIFAGPDNCLIDTDHENIVDPDASRPNKTAEVSAMRKMIVRSQERFALRPD